MILFSKLFCCCAEERKARQEARDMSLQARHHKLASSESTNELDEQGAPPIRKDRPRTAAQLDSSPAHLGKDLQNENHLYDTRAHKLKRHGRFTSIFSQSTLLFRILPDLVVEDATVSSHF